MALGRYSTQYDRLRRIGDNDTDLAIARFGKARVSCWTCPSKRQWGVHGPEGRHAAVMHFQIEADPGSEEGILSNFELDLNFVALHTEPMNIQSVPAPHPALEDGEGATVRLIGAPAPRFVSHSAKNWTFWSTRLSDIYSGEAMAARWAWQSIANDALKEKVLHGGVAVHHPGAPFRVKCQVRGKVSKPGGIILKFSERHHQPRTWILAPQDCQKDLQHHIEQLEADMEALNKSNFLSSGQFDVDRASNLCVRCRESTNTSVASQSTTLGTMNSTGTTLPSSMVYGATTISDQSNVQMGNQYYHNYYSCGHNDRNIGN